LGHLSQISEDVHSIDLLRQQVRRVTSRASSVFQLLP